MHQNPQIEPSLIVRLPNWVGDVIMALPLLQTLSHLGIHLELLGKLWIQDLLAASPFQLHSLERSFWQNRRKLAAIPTENLLLLTNSFSSALMGRLAHKKSIGYAADKRSLLLQKSPAKTAGRHEVEYFWELGKEAIAHWYPSLSWPEKIPMTASLSLNPSLFEPFKEELSKPFWVLCPFAHSKSKDGQSKIWPHWASLSKHLKTHQLLVCPGKNEEALCASLVPDAKILPNLNLAEFAALLSRAEQVVANDSGPMHLAAAVGAKTLGIFGVSDPLRTFPWGGDFIGGLGVWPSVEEVLERLDL